MAQRARTVLDNTLFLLLARVGDLSIGLVLTPFVVGNLGLEAYGLWAVLSTLTRYFGLLDLGVGSAFVKHMAEYAARRENDRVRQVMSFGVLFYLGLAVLLAPLAFWLVPVFLDSLSLSDAARASAASIFPLLFATYFFSTALGAVTAILYALEAMRVLAIVNVVGHVIYGLVVVIGLQTNLGLYALWLALAIEVTFNALAQMVVARRLFGPLFASPFGLERTVVRRLMGFGAWMQVNTLSHTINTEVDRVLIGRFVNVSSVTYYEIANKLAMLTKILPLTFLQALLPSASKLAATDRGARLDDAYVQASRLLALATFALGGFLVGAAAPIVHTWMGAGYAEVPLILGILVLAYSIHNLTGVGTTLARALGKPRYESYYAMLQAALNVAATIALTPRFGLYGVLLGTLLGSVVGSAYFLVIYHRLRGLSLWEGLGSWLTRLGPAVALSTLGVWVASIELADLWMQGRLAGLLVLPVLGLLYVSLLTVLLRLTRFLGPTDLSVIRNLLPARFTPVLEWRSVQFVFGGGR